MKYLLDTDTCIYIIKQRPEKVLKRFRAVEPGDVAISTITLSELLFGVEKSERVAQNREALEAFLLPFEITDYGSDAAERYGTLRAALARKGTLIGSNDLFIAAHALALGVPLVSNNVREFGRVPGLRVENWG